MVFHVPTGKSGRLAFPGTQAGRERAEVLTHPRGLAKFTSRSCAPLTPLTVLRLEKDRKQSALQREKGA